MITINNLKITDAGANLNIKVTTNVGHTITSALFWKMNDFKNLTLAIDLTEYLLQLSNVEDVVINAENIGLSKFEDLCFVKLTSSYVDTNSCGDLLSPTIGITYDLSTYYGCLLSYLLEIPLDCSTCDNTKLNQMVVTINMLIDTVIKAVDIAYYTEAIFMVNRLKELCGLNKCTNCAPVECPSCNNFIQI